MKNSAFPFFLTITIVAVSMASCDQLDDPVEGIVEPIPEEYNVPAIEPNYFDNQRVLIEDFTGHQCGNCPDANVVLIDLYNSHSGQVIPLAVHAGSLATTNEEYPTDWTCAEGDEYWQSLDIPVNPIGRVNRSDNEGISLLPSQWEEALTPLLSQDPAVGMRLVINDEFDADKLFIHVHNTWLQAGSGEYKLALLIVENHLVGPQLWYGNDPEYIEEFEFEHVLRGSVTGAKGEVVATDPVQGDAAQFDYVFTWNDEWIKENCDVIAVLTEVESGRVVQVTSEHIVE